METDPQIGKKLIRDMTDTEKSTLIDADPDEYRRRWFDEERPRAEAQVDQQLEQMRRLRELGSSGLADSES